MLEIPISVVLEMDCFVGSLFQMDQANLSAMTFDDLCDETDSVQIA
jgi:hypothetical protein